MAKKGTLPVGTIDELFKALSVLSRTVDHILQERAVEEALDGPVSYSKVQVLRLLHARGGQTSSQIARFLGITRPSVSQITEALERAEWITRRPGEKDARESIHELGEEGRRQFAAVRRQQRHLLRNTVRLADPRTAEVWTKLLKEIAGSLAQADKAYKEYCLQCGAHSDGTCVLVGGEADCPFLHHHDRGGHNAARRPPRRRSR